MTPPKLPRPPTLLGDRNEDNRRRTPPLGIPSVFPAKDDLTPPPMDAIDEVEVKAVRIERRAQTIANRPGPTPSQEALQSALTIAGVRTELKSELAEVKADMAEVKKDVRTVTGTLLPALINELSQDREQRRRAEGMELEADLTIKTKRAATAIEEEAAAKAAARDAKKTNRETRNKVIAGIATGTGGGFGLWELFHRLFG